MARVSGEHGFYYEHGQAVYEELARVPLILHHEGLPAKLKVPGAVSLVDLPSTLLELLGVAQPEGIGGRSFTAALHGEQAYPREHHFVMGAFRYGYQTHAVRTDSQKLIFDVDIRFLPIDSLLEQAVRWWLPPHAFNVYRTKRITRELYDLHTDPEELRNVVRERPELGSPLSERLWRWMDDQYRSTRRSNHPEIPAEIDESLRALGYLD